MYNRITKARMFLLFEDEQGNLYEAAFPNVQLSIEPEIEPGERWGDEFLSYQSPGFVEAVKIEGKAYRAKENDLIMTVKLVKKGRRK